MKLWNRIKSVFAAHREKALKAIKLAGDFVFGVTPNKIDDAIWNRLKTKYPRLFEAELTLDEKKLYALAVASETLKSELPMLSTSASRKIISDAYLETKE